MKQSTHGFTLVELSIVLIIIGLIIAGVTSGSSLIKSATLNGVLSDYRSYQSAYNNFKNRYGQVPGDYNDAASSWGTTNFTSACNGDNNGAIGSAASLMEVQNAMYELSASGMITAQIPATSSAGCASTTLNSTTLPQNSSKALYSMVNGALDVIFRGSTSTNTVLWSTTAPAPQNVLLIGKTLNLYPNITPVYLAIDTKNMDTKIDDGMPQTGNFRGMNPIGPLNCNVFGRYNDDQFSTPGCIIAIALDAN